MNPQLGRRRALRVLGGAGLGVVLASCSSDRAAGPGAPASATHTSPGSTSSPDTSAANECVAVPEEIAGPYPLDLSGDEVFFRRDITDGLPGLPLALTLELGDTNARCRPVEGVRVDVWHCDKDGVYSGFEQPGTDARGTTFMRGIQVSDADGVVRFDTIYPGWYTGRVTHVHFQVFVGERLVTTSQLVFPEDLTRSVYDTDLYAARGQNTSIGGFADDVAFADGTEFQMCTVTGAPSGVGFEATLAVGVAA